MDKPTKVSQCMAAKTQDAAQNENKMTEPNELYDSTEIVEPTVPSTSTESYPSSHLKMLRREIQDSTQNENKMSEPNEFDNSLEIVKLAVPSTSTGSHLSSQSRMLHRETQDVVQSENKMAELVELDDSLEPAVASTSSTSQLSLQTTEQNLKFEIESIGLVMSAVQTQIKRWLSLINDETFPEEYLQEYMDGVNKLHELQCKQLKLKDVQEMQETENLKKLAEEIAKTSSTLIVHFPNNQHTAVQIKKGLTLRNAVAKAMERRQLTTNECAAYVTCRITYFISWDTDISTLQCNEVFVETLDKFPVPILVSHNFVNTKFLLGYCCICSKTLLFGFYCTICNRKFHMKCAGLAPPLCERVKGQKAYYQRLLANNPTTGILQVRNETESIPSTSSAPHQTNQIQEHSTSVSNTAINKTTGISQIRKKIESSVPQRLFKKRKQRLSSSSSELYADHSIVSTKDKNIHIDLRTKHAKSDSINQDNLADSVASTSYEKCDRKRDDKRDKRHNKKRDKKGTYDTEDAESDDSGESIFSRSDSIKDWKIVPDQIQFDSRIGQGSFGTVYKAYWHGPVAVKTLNAKVPSTTQLNAFKNEVNVLRKTRHKNILLFMGCISKPHFAIITQWCDGSSLYHHLHILDNKFEVLTIIIICKQISEGMDYLHSKDILHRDLKSSNIFFHSGLHVKIGDFGLAAVKSQQWVERSYQPAGSVLWMAPEVIRMKEKYPYSFKSDVYAFGIILYELFTKELPYKHLKCKEQIMLLVGRGILRPDLNKIRRDIPEDLQKLLVDCTALNRDDRPLFDDIWKRVYAVYYITPKIRKTTSVPSVTDELPDTYIEKEDELLNFADCFLDEEDR